MGSKRNFSLSLWDHKDNFLCLLKSANSDFEGQSFQEDIIENINGEKTLTLSVPMYIFNYDLESNNKFERNNICWDYIHNEQKIRYIEYDELFNNPIRIQEFVLKNFTESRDGEQKIANCECESLAVYELGKVGWNINFDTEYINTYDFLNNEEVQTIDYWLKKIFYFETNLGRVSTSSECVLMMQGLQLRNDEGYPIDSLYSSDSEGNLSFSTIEEPTECTPENFEEFYNPTGWTWEIQSNYTNNPFHSSLTTFLYEEPTIAKYVEVTPGNYLGFSLQKDTEGNEKLLPHPIEEEGLEYVTKIKRRLLSVERSNVFSAIQDVAEAFEVWPYFVYEYNEQGKIIQRKVIFKTEAINEKIKFDFSYGKNIINCQRNIDSNDLITKLIVTDTESQLGTGNILSIRQSSANPTGENYLYNFDYFYDLGSLSRLTYAEKRGDINVTTHSDEYIINQYYAKLRKFNDEIGNIQKFLLPLYNRRDNLQAELTVKEASINGYKDNIQSIQQKLDVIPPSDTYIRSWSEDCTQYNHVGVTKTFSETTIANSEDNYNTYFYINFGRDDIIYSDTTSDFHISYTTNDGEFVEKDFSVPAFIPRLFAYESWHNTESTTLTIDNETNFALLVEGASTSLDDEARDIQINEVKTVPSDFGDGRFIKGVYFTFVKKGKLTTYARVRYLYAPMIYYNLLIKDYWEKLLQVEEEKKLIEEDLKAINNKILINELNLKRELNDKKKLILQFEKDYSPFIREGFWEPDQYQSQIINKSISSSSHSGFNGLVFIDTKLSDLNLNNSLNNYSYYINLGKINQIDIDSINMNTPGKQEGDLPIPRRREQDYQLYQDINNNLIIGISPELIDYYKAHDYAVDKYYSNISYSEYKGTTTLEDESEIEEWEITTTTISWTPITEFVNPTIREKFFYIDDDNILTSSLKVYKGDIPNEDELLEPFTDYTYSFDYVAYDTEGERKDISKQEVYDSDLYYDYITKITFKLTNNVNKNINNKFNVTYEVESTLEYLYNDAVASSKKYSVPQVTYSLSVVDLSSLNGYKNYKPLIGQKVPIYDKEMGFNGYEGFITSIQRELESPENTEIEIATFETKFEDIFQKLTATMTDIRYNSNEIRNAANSFTTNGGLKVDVFQRSLDDNNFKIQLGVNNDIIIDKKSGITLVDQDNNNGVKIIGNGIFLTDDYASQNWKTGITGEGINASAITVGNIDTKNINIWNASEGQIRFVWNEEGLIAYGDEFGDNSSTTTTPGLINYSTYVKFNQNGLDFNDNGKSALKLGWDGLKINTQNNSLILDADKGLVITDWTSENGITRLELGKLNGLYGLKLYDKDGNSSFQSDSDGNLWLSQHIKVGGQFNGEDYTISPTAGIYGDRNIDEENKVPLDMQMGFRRDDRGIIIWDDSPIRFWAGPLDQNSYTTLIHATSTEVQNALTTKNISEKDVNELGISPTFAKFKVSSNGDIIASGIDVGGWIGEGDKLRSFDNQAILRSNDYIVDGTNYPVLAIGKSTSGNIDGTDYNFKVYEDGTLNIGNGSFIATSTGISIVNSDISMDRGNIAGFTVDATKLSFVNGRYKTLIQTLTTASDIAFAAGTSTNPEFIVRNDGSLQSSYGDIGGWTISGTSGIQKINGNSGTFIKPNANNSAPVILIGTSTNTVANNVNTNFAVTGDGAVYFKQGIYGWSTSKSMFKKGYTEGAARSLYTSSGGTIDIEICQGLIIDVR